jgi:hypothetical protein
MQPSSFGRTQKIFIGVLFFPFYVASGAFLTGLMSPAEWAALVQFLAVTVAVPFFGFGQAGKMWGKTPAPTPAPENPPDNPPTTPPAGP